MQFTISKRVIGLALSFIGLLAGVLFAMKDMTYLWDWRGVGRIQQILIGISLVVVVVGLVASFRLKGMLFTVQAGWREISLTAVTLLITILTAEGIVRLVFPEIGWRQFSYPRSGWASLEYVNFDPGTARAKDNELRILMLGDSFLAGSGVESLDDRFPIQMAKMTSSNVTVQILAAGGWGTDQELLAFLDKGKDWDPDIVILVFTAYNDTWNNVTNYAGPRLYKPYFVVDDSDGLQLYDYQGIPVELDHFLTVNETDTLSSGGNSVWHSYTFDLIRYVVRSYIPDEKSAAFDQVDPRYRLFQPGQDRYHEIYRENPRLSWSPQLFSNHASAYIHEDFEMNAYQWRLFSALLQRLKMETEAIDARLVLMLLPVTFKPQDTRFIVGGSFEQVFETPDGPFTFRATEPRDRIRAIAEARGVELFDPTMAFITFVEENSLSEVLWPDPDDRHFTDAAHDWLAEQLLYYLEEDFHETPD